MRIKSCFFVFMCLVLSISWHQPSIAQSLVSQVEFYRLFRQYGAPFGYWSPGYLDQWDLIKLDDLTMDAELRAIRKLKAGDDHDKIIAAVRKYWSKNRPTIVSYKVAWDKLARRDPDIPLRLLANALMTDVGTDPKAPFAARIKDGWVVQYAWRIRTNYFPNSNPHNFNRPGMVERFGFWPAFGGDPRSEYFRMPAKEKAVLMAQIYGGGYYIGQSREILRRVIKAHPDYLPASLSLIPILYEDIVVTDYKDSRGLPLYYDTRRRAEEARQLAASLRKRHPNRADVLFFYLNTVPEAQFFRLAPEYLKMDDLQWRKITIEHHYRILQDRVKRGSKLFDKWP